MSDHIQISIQHPCVCKPWISGTYRKIPNVLLILLYHSPSQYFVLFHSIGPSFATYHNLVDFDLTIGFTNQKYRFPLVRLICQSLFVRLPLVHCFLSIKKHRFSDWSIVSTYYHSVLSHWSNAFHQSQFSPFSIGSLLSTNHQLVFHIGPLCLPIKKHHLSFWSIALYQSPAPLAK